MMNLYKQKCILESELNAEGWIDMTEVALKKWGNSQGIRIPKAILEKIGVSGNDARFDLTVNEHHEIVLKKQDEPSNLKELFAGFDYQKYWADYEKTHGKQSKEIDWGKPVGKEIW